MIAPLERAFGIDEDVGDILDVAYLVVAAADLEQRVVGRADLDRSDRTGGSPKARAPAGGQLPILALDVVDDGRTGQVSRVGTTRPTPLPERVGAKHMTCSGPSCRR